MSQDSTALGLEQYWIYTAPADYSTDAYKEQFKAIIADVASTAGGAEIIVEIVTDREIALAESPSTMDVFIAEHGQDYFVNEIPAKESLGWVASYTGGYDYDTGTMSTDADAYEIVWFIASTGSDPLTSMSFETWKPEDIG